MNAKKKKKVIHVLLHLSFNIELRYYSFEHNQIRNMIFSLYFIIITGYVTIIIDILLVIIITIIIITRF